MNEYEKLLSELNSKRCEACMGSGTVTDAEAGDIWFNEHTCFECDGSGLEPIKEAPNDR